MSRANTSGARSRSPTTVTDKKKYPGLVLLQWASPPYPLQKAWVTDRAAEGWLAVNIEPHDVMPDQPKEYYDALPAELKSYNTIETRNRDKNYFLYMYLADIRAVDYLAEPPGLGRQDAGGHGHEHGRPAEPVRRGAASESDRHAHQRARRRRRQRQCAWPQDRLSVLGRRTTRRCMKTAEYFDTVNCAARIKVPSLVSMGFIDTVTPPVGIWAAFNQIKGPKEAAPMPESPHNHLATPEQSMPWTQRIGRLAERARRRDARRSNAADVATPRTDTNSKLAHEQLLAKRTAGQIDVYFMGDSITRRWGTTDEQYKDFLANWRANFTGWNAADFGWGADKTQHMLWRLQNGELDGVNPKIVVLMAGTNNVGRATPLGDTEQRAADVARGVAAVVREIRKRAPDATVVITGITPRNDNIAVMPVINRANLQIATLADGKTIRYININEAAGVSRQPVTRRHGARRPASDGQGVPGLGRRLETDLHGDSGSAGRRRSRAAADRRSERPENPRSNAPQSP